MSAGWGASNERTLLRIALKSSTLKRSSISFGYVCGLSNPLWVEGNHFLWLEGTRGGDEKLSSI